MWWRERASSPTLPTHRVSIDRGNKLNEIYVRTTQQTRFIVVMYIIMSAVGIRMCRYLVARTRSSLMVD